MKAILSQWALITNFRLCLILKILHFPFFWTGIFLGFKDRSSAFRHGLDPNI